MIENIVKDQHAKAVSTYHIDQVLGGNIFEDEMKEMFKNPNSIRGIPDVRPP